MAKYTITVKDNENGRTVVSTPANTVIGALVSESGASTIVLKGTECETVAAVNLVQHVITRIFEEDEGEQADEGN